MKRFLDIIIFISILALIAIANNSFLGINFGKQKEGVKFAPSLNIDRIVYTDKYAKNITGYGGPIPMAIGVDKDSIIKDIKILKNAETPEYLNQVINTGLLNNWIGKSIDEKSNVKVDAITGATMSSKAIIDSLNATINPTEAEAKSVVDFNQLIKSLSVVFIGLIAMFSFFSPKKVNKFRALVLASSVLILGIWQGSMLSMAKISAWFLYGTSDVFQWPLIAILFASIIIPMIIGKNFYCYHLCPFGAAQELVGQTFETKKRSLFKWLINIRIALLLMCVVFLLLGLVGNVANIEPFSAFKPKYAPFSSVIIFITFLILSVFINRPWCKYFCPCGAFLDLFKKNKEK